MKENFGLTILEKDTDKEEKNKRYDYEKSIESVSDFLLTLLENKKEYKEKIPLTRERNIDVPSKVKDLGTHVDGSFSLLVQYAKHMELSQKGLYELAKEISSRHQEIRFSFKMDPGLKWIEYTATKEFFNIGDEVLLKTDEMEWDKPKKISSIQEASGKKYVFFDDSGTGMPLENFVHYKKS